jgi:hypothetical protein
MARFAAVLGCIAAIGGWACGGADTAQPGDDGIGNDGIDGCSDLDEDGYGAGPTCLGADCDDGNPAVWDADDCAELCEADPRSTGCSCDPRSDLEPVLCYQGNEATLGIGPCRAGLRRCIEDEGVWSACDNQVLPRTEVCDEADNDCNGLVDEGVTNECGTCAPECNRACVGQGEGCRPFDIAENGSNVEACEGDENCLTLGGRTISLHVIWIANTAEGTVSKMDTRTREQEGRYRTGSLGPADSPSRTTVDYLGDVVVANRAFGQQASITRIASEDCPDQNRNGRVETSEGGDDVLEWGDDECILWSSDVGCGRDEGGWGVGCGIARAVAVQDRVGLDGVLDERVWVGLFNELGYYEIDRTDGSETGEFADCSPCTPYGAAIDRDGNLWSACLSQYICRFDTDDVDDAQTYADPSGSNYGITVDEEGKVWTGGNCSMFDPDEERFTQIPGCGGTGIASDGEGYLWVGSCWAGGTCRIDAETLEYNVINTAQSYGVGVDFDGYVWGVPYYSGYVDLIDPGSGPGDESVERILNDCPGPCLTGPYTYSDMTGYQLRNATDPQGFYSHIFEGCNSEAQQTYWTAIAYDATMPASSSVQLAVRSANDLETLASASFSAVGSLTELESPVSLEEAIGEGPHAQYLEVRVTLFADSAEARPQVRSFEAQWYCDIPIE